MDEENDDRSERLINPNENDVDEIVGSIELKRSRRNQIMAALAATLGGFVCGTMLGWSSPGIPSIEDRGDFGILTASERSWIGSIANLGATFSGFVAGYGIEKFGRRKSMLLLASPCIFGWVLLACAQNIAMILASRFIIGFATASFCVVGPVYISEVVESEIRGFWGTAFTVILAIGILFVYALGTVLSWIWISVIGAVVPFIMCICVWFIPETPRYLLARGNLEEAAKSLKWLRNAHADSDIEAELEMLQKGVLEDATQSTNIRDLFHASILKPLLICIALMFFQQLGGINAVNFYSVDIFRDAGSDIDPNLSCIVIAAVQVVVLAFSAVLVDRNGRRVLFIISDTGMAVSLGTLGIFFYLKAENGEIVPDNLGWLPLASLIMYMIMYNVFLGSGPWLMMAELLPSRVKGLASAIVSSFCWFLAFVVTKNFEDVSTLIEPYGCYWIFSSFSALGVLFGFLFLPETKGKTLLEIQDLFS